MTIDPNNLAATAKLTFAEDFNELSLWNGSSGAWNTSFVFGGYNASTLSNNGELQWYINANDPDQATVKPWNTSNGILTITANPTDPSMSSEVGNLPYTSGLLTSQFSFLQTYGYFEMDAKLPSGQGLWPAFWLMPTSGDWRPEIDVMEVITSDTTSLWQFSHPADQSYDRYFNTTVPDMSLDFHRYGVDWQPDKLTFYFDGKVTGVAPTPPEMHGPMYMLLNLAVGGSWAGPPNAATTFPANLQVDYIRAYQSITDVVTTNFSFTSEPVSRAEGPSGASTSYVFTVSRSGDLSAGGSVSWSAVGSGANPTNAADFAGGAPSGTLIFAPGQGNAAITIKVAGDAVTEPNETFSVVLSNPVGGSVVNGAVTGTITNDDSLGPPTLALSPASLTMAEGASGTSWFTYVVTRSGDTAGPSVVSWAVTGSGAHPTSANDFVGGAFQSGQLFYGGGETSKNIWVQVNGDGTAEFDEGFTVTLSNPSGAVIAPSGATAEGVIRNDDGSIGTPAAPSLSIGPTSVSQAEGSSGATAFSYTVTRSGDLSAASSASWSVAGSGANTASAADFTGGVLPTGTVSFAAGQATATINVNVAGDLQVEANEGFTVSLSGPSGASLGVASASGVIQNDDVAPAAPSLSIGPPSISQVEGSSGATAFSYTVTRSGDLSAASSASWSVAGSGANAASAADFTGGVLPTGTVSFAAGQATATINVNVAGDLQVEANEGFTVSLSGPSGASLGVASASGVIQNDDVAPAAPSLSIGPPSISQVEGASGATAFSYTVTRSGDLSAASSASWSVAGSGANAASAADFTGGVLPTGTVSFAAGQATATINVNVAGDLQVEANEGFTVSLSGPSGASLGVASASGVIQNDDVAPAAPSLSIGPPSISQVEGASGATAFSYTVTRSGDLSAASSASWSVAGSGANAASAADFTGGVLPTGTVSFAAGQATATINVNVAGDLQVEANEGFTVSLSGPSGASLGVASASGVIQNDDVAPAAPSLSIGPPSISQAEGSSGATAFSYTVTRSGDLSAASSASWSVAGSGANAASAADFTGGVLPTGTVSFAAGQATATINVNVAGDLQVEANEGFTVSLSGPSGASLGTATAAGLITNDDQPVTNPGNTGTAGNDVFTLSPTSTAVITGFDAQGQDVLAVPTGSGGFSLAGYSGQASLNMVDASAWWNNISNAQVIRWTGDLAAVDSAAKVDGLLQAMPGHGGGGRLFIGGAPGGQVAVYYDADPTASGGVTHVATLRGVATTAGITSADFSVTGGAPPPPPPPAPTPATAPTISLSSSDTAGPEGATGSTAFAFTLQRAGDLSAPSQVQWAVEATGPQGASLANGADFVGGSLPSGTLTFAAGESTATVAVNVAGDPVVEPAEYFTFRLSAPANATLGQSSAATSVIVNDDAMASSGPNVHSGPTQSGTAQDDIFSLSSSPSAIFNYDTAGDDTLGLRSGSGGFQLAGHTGQADLTVVDAGAWWNSIGGAQVVRWTGEPTAVDTPAEVDALLEAMPGNGGGGRLFIGGAEGGKVGVYYDSDPASRGNVSMVATIENLTSPISLTADDFHLFA